MTAASEPGRYKTDIDIERNEIIRNEIRYHLRYLSRRNAVRRIASAILENQPPATDITPLLTAVSNAFDAKWRERAMAAWALGYVELNSRQRIEVADALGALVQDRAYPCWRIPGTVIRYFLRSLWLTVPLIALIQMPLGGDRLEGVLSFILGEICCSVLLAVFTAPILFPISLLIDYSRSDHSRINAARTLGRLGMTESIGALAKAAQRLHYEIRKASLQALRKLLPCLRQDDYGRLSSDTVPNLCVLLRSADVTAALAIIDALEKIGDSRAVSTVELLVSRMPVSQVTEAAERLLIILRERARQENEPKTLLRSSSEIATPAVLLRAVASVDDSLSRRELLRATLSEPQIVSHSTSPSVDNPIQNIVH